MPPPGCASENIGKRDGCVIRAVTDAAGSHVIVKGKKRHLLHACKSQKEAVAAGRKVLKEGFNCVKWQQPISNLFDVYLLMSPGLRFGKPLLPKETPSDATPEQAEVV